MHYDAAAINRFDLTRYHCGPRQPLPAIGQ